MTDFIVFDMGSLDDSIEGSFQNMKTLITTHKPKNVLFFGGWELLYPFINGYLNIKDNVRYEFEIIHEFGDFLEKNNVQFHLILSSFDDNIFIRFRNKPVKNFNLHFWKTWCLFGLHDYLKERGTNLFEKRIDKDFNNLFVCFMNKRKYHRQFLIDLLCENDLFKHGIITWNNGKGNFIDAKNHEFKCWNETILTYDNYIDEPFIDSSLKTKCLINLVTETHRDGLFFSEKTWKPIMTGQPFISLGAKNQNKIMKELGFELYDELFDYGFDELESVEDRATGLVANLVKLKGHNFNEMYNSILEKLQFNKNRAEQILNESLYIPDIILDLFKKHNTGSEITYQNVMRFLFDHKKNKI